MKVFGCWLLTAWVVAAGCGNTEGDPPRSSAAPVPTEPEYVVETTGRETTLLFPHYTMVVQHGNPFGIASLKMTGQRADFAHQELPLGDWEWFKIDLDNKQQWLKLIMPEWDSPTVELYDDHVIVRFFRRDAIESDVVLGVEYRIELDRPEFDIQYSIRNFSSETLTAPYVMLGFPGFSNHGQVSAIETALDHRVPAPPHDNFRDEAIAVGKDEYLLLRHDVYPRLNPRDILKGVVSIAEEGRVFSLESSFDPDGTYTHVYSAHTNKPRYLTSHAYVYLANIPRGQERDLTIHYTLSSAALSNP